MIVLDALQERGSVNCVVTDRTEACFIYLLETSLASKSISNDHWRMIFKLSWDSDEGKTDQDTQTHRLSRFPTQGKCCYCISVNLSTRKYDNDLEIVMFYATVSASYLESWNARQSQPVLATKGLTQLSWIAMQKVLSMVMENFASISLLASKDDYMESLQAVETLQWENILTVGSSSNSGNHSTNSGNPLALYSQQSSPKLDTSPSYQISRIK
ncbi:hypothetical protein Tco_0343123 [Tanacetum coccineum]